MYDIFPVSVLSPKHPQALPANSNLSFPRFALMGLPPHIPHEALPLKDLPCQSMHKPIMQNLRGAKAA